MGIFKEKPIAGWAGILILIAAFLALYEPWGLGIRELFREEGLYAVQAAEYDLHSAVVTAHGVTSQTAFPLFPALVSLLFRLTGVPMEYALRLVSVIILGATAVLVYFAAASERSWRSGCVAAAMFLSSWLSVEKGTDGYPATTSAFLLLAAQLVFFQFGIRRNSWNQGWIFNLALLSLGFLAGGFPVLLFFVFPMFFFRRPLSVKSKFSKPGFAVGITLLAATVGFWLFSGWELSNRGAMLQEFLWQDNSFQDYLANVLMFPIELPLRLMPWTLIAWIPFCVALQALDETPIFSRYLRTLCFATLGLLWLLPENDPREIFFLLGPWSILVGIHYELAMRRYGFKIRRLLVIGEIFAFFCAALLLTVCFVPEAWLTPFISLGRSLAFREPQSYLLSAAAAAAVTAVLAMAIRHGRNSWPVWLILLLISVAGGLFYWNVMQPYRAQENDKRIFGETVAAALAREPAGKLYKSNILDLYGELYYSGTEVRRILELDELPTTEEVVYLISTEFPQYPDRSWVNLLAPDYSYRGHRLFLWKGTLRPAADN